jgi:hypothetical protein
MTTAEYRAADAVNFSTLKHILTSPAHYRAELEAERKETPALLLGTLVHAVILERTPLADICAIKPPEMSLATKEGKAWKAEQAGKPIISDADADHIVGMARSVAANPHAVAMLQGCPQREQPMFASVRGVESKALIDAFGTDGEEWVICDLKTTDDASPDAFARKVEGYHYDMQAAFYSEILSLNYQIECQPHFYWLTVEKAPPYTCAVHSAVDWMEAGHEKVRRALSRLKECRATNQWPQPWGGINILKRPAWLKTNHPTIE